MVYEGRFMQQRHHFEVAPGAMVVLDTWAEHLPDGEYGFKYVAQAVEVTGGATVEDANRVAEQFIALRKAAAQEMVNDWAERFGKVKADD